jgi:hypothetical protein
MRPFVILCTLAAASFLHAQNIPDHAPNATKYKDSSIPTGKGRAGSATIEARALLGKDGITTLDVTTGAGGSIDKVKAKIAATGTAFTFDGSGTSTATNTIDKLARYEKLEVTANVSGIDGARTDIVTANEVVKRRPNLATWPDVAPVQFTDLPVEIGMVVEEMNGDVGARANCVLLVDGVEVDRANDIWVDAGRGVTCRFSHTFTTPGTKQLTFKVTDVTPGDWDLADNTMTHPIEVRQRQDFDDYFIRATDIHSTERYDAVSSWREEHWTREGWRSTLNFRGYTSRLLMNFDQFNAGFRLSTDGQLIDDSSSLPLRRSSWSYDEPWGTQRGGCVVGRTAYKWLTSCGSAMKVGDGPWVGGTSINFYLSAGDVTYHSEGWDQTYLDLGYDYWTWNYDQTETYGAQTRFGNHIGLDVTLSDGETTLDVHPTVDMQPYDFQWSNSFCYPTWDGDMCVDYDHLETGRIGELWHP